ncbi:MAG: putative porin [Deltaproteobacteria bacterium]|nr:putative porin [Deltaproteobacteria bacterium]
MLAAVLAIAWGAPSPARAANQEDLEQRIKLLEQALGELKSQLTEVKVTQASEAKVPAWAERIEFYGDARFRFEDTSYDEFNGKDKDNKDRFRVRLRFGARSQIRDDVEVGFRLVTGGDDDPTSTNQTMGNYWAEYTNIGFDRAYVTYTPDFVPEKGLSFTFGKAANPFKTTYVIWDGDVVPEGAFLKYEFNKAGNITPYALVTGLVLQQNQDWSSNVYPWGGQLGVKGKAGIFGFDVATSYLDWQKFGEDGNLPPNIHGNPEYTEGGVTRLSTFKVWDLYGEGSLKFASKGKVGLWGQYLTNTDATGPYSDKDMGWGAGAFVSWDVFKFKADYKYLEANATPGFIADSDSGYVNREGMTLTFAWKMFKYGTFELKYYDTEPVDDDVPGATNSSQTIFTDFIFKF